MLWFGIPCKSRSGGVRIDDWVSPLNTRYRYNTQVIEARRCVGVDGSSTTSAGLLSPRLVLVTTARCLLFGAKLPNIASAAISAVYTRIDEDSFITRIADHWGIS